MPPPPPAAVSSAVRVVSSLCSTDDDWAAGLDRLAPYRNMTFWNFDGTLQFELMRMAPFLPSTAHVMVLRFVYRESSEAAALVNSGYISRDDFAADTEQHDSTRDDFRSSVVLDGVMSRRQVNEVWRLTTCGCGKYVRSGRDLACAMCYLTGAVRTSTDEACPVCLETGLSAHMPSTKCCAHRVHAECLERCGARCPLCRGAPR